MKACEPAITITAIPIVIYDGVLVAEGPNGRPAGVAVIQPLPQPLTFDLTHFFIDPAFMRRGIGNTLFDAIVGLMAGKGGRILRIEADPFAAGFYEKLGARRIGDVPSESISGRMLPLFKYAIR
jgi:GNAT superfamily N-acetyltransferase